MTAFHWFVPAHLSFNNWLWHQVSWNLSIKYHYESIQYFQWCPFLSWDTLLKVWVWSDTEVNKIFQLYATATFPSYGQSGRVPRQTYTFSWNHSGHFPKHAISYFLAYIYFIFLPYNYNSNTGKSLRNWTLRISNNFEITKSPHWIMHGQHGTFTLWKL